MGARVAVNGLTLVHKGNSALTIATVPDVCKTPSPGGPVPIPYPNISRSSTLEKGTKKVSVDGQMVAIKGSQYGSSNGDEAGTAGGVKSGKNMKGAKWLSYSFDVKMEGKNACRLTDKMTCNAGNTVCLGGTIVEFTPQGKDVADDLEELAKKCNREVNLKEGYSEEKRPKGEECRTLGLKKHKCCEDSIKAYNEKNPDSKIRSEVAYDKAGNPIDANKAAAARELAGATYDKAKQEALAKTNGRRLSKSTRRRLSKLYMKTYFKDLDIHLRADVVVLNKPGEPAIGNIEKVYDFKFNCKPASKKPSKHMSTDQQEKYQRTLKTDPETIHIPGYML